MSVITLLYRMNNTYLQQFDKQVAAQTKDMRLSHNPGQAGDMSIMLQSRQK
jgi:hypothetical protein